MEGRIVGLGQGGMDGFSRIHPAITRRNTSTGETFLHINRQLHTRSIVVKHGCIVHLCARTRCGDLETMHSSAAIDFSIGRRIE